MSANSANTLVIRHARAITLAGDAGVRKGPAMSQLAEITDAALVCRDDKLVWVGPDSDLPAKLVADAIELDVAGACVLPGFVDSHTHVVWGGSRKDEMEMRIAGADYEAIFAAGGGILSSVRQTRESSEASLLEQSLIRVRRMQATGTTTLEIKSGYGLDLATEIRQLVVARELATRAGLRVRTTCLAAHAIPQEFRASEATRAAYVQQVCTEILPAIAAKRLADFCDVFCDRGAFTVDESRAVLLQAKALGLGIRLHANELGETGGAGLAAEVGAASADHLLYVTAAERAAMAVSGVVGTLLPGTSLTLRKPYADGRALVDAGVAVAIATDCNPGSCAIESMPMVIALACHGNRLSPAEAICAATHHAAVSLGVAHETGRLQAGLAADMVVLATDDYRDLVYHAGSPLVHAVIAGGVQLNPSR